MKKLSRKLLAITIAALLSGCATYGELSGPPSQSVYLPSSVMSATLLSGAVFDTSHDSKGNPTPMIARIQGPATLPNELTTSILEGCIVTLEGQGEVSTERVLLRLVNVFCLDKDGHKTIDQQLKGYVTDEKGMAGLTGEVAYKKGSSFPSIVIPPGRQVSLYVTQGATLNILQNR